MSMRARAARMAQAAAVLAAVVLVIGGCAAARKAAALNSRPAAAVKPASGAVHFIDYSIDSDGPRSSVIVTGAIGDWGSAETVFPDGKIDPQHMHELQLSLQHGTFRLPFAALDKKIRGALGHWPSNPRTCSGSISVRATLPVVPGSGTGLYKGISGSFSVTATIDEVDVKPVCNGTSRFLAQVILLVGSGTVASG
jgi:hypothetical protein